jgi:hypothetical protein
MRIIEIPGKDGNTFTTTWMGDFDIANKFGLGAIRETYDRAVKEWHTQAHNIEYVTALYMALNYQLWDAYYANDNAKQELYDTLFYDLQDKVYAEGAYSKDDLNYFCRVTD